MRWERYMPTRKWFTARVTALTGLATMWATTGTWDKEETIGLITLVSAAALAYRVRNKRPAPRPAVLESREPREAVRDSMRRR